MEDALYLFAMPGPTFIADYNDDSKDLHALAKPGVGDVIKVLGTVKEVVGLPHLLQMAGKQKFRNKIRDEYGVDLRSFIAQLALGR